MSELVPAWPPGLSASRTVDSPSLAAFMAADKPAGPPPITATSYSFSMWWSPLGWVGVTGERAAEGAIAGGLAVRCELGAAALAGRTLHRHAYLVPQAATLRDGTDLV